MRLRIFLWLVLVFLVTFEAWAQAEDLLLIRNANGLWLWSGPDEPAHQFITTPAYGLRRSPDGVDFAYPHPARWQRDEAYISSDILIFHLDTDGFFSRVTVQPPNASKEHFAIRTTPSWSPDGTRLVWGDLLYPENTHQVLVYDVATRETSVLVDNVPVEGDAPMVTAKWGQTGIATLRGVFSSESETVRHYISVYDEDGSLLSTTRAAPPDRRLFAWMWMMDGDDEYVGVLLNDGSWYLIDPFTGEVQSMDGVPELYTPLAPDGVSVYFQYNGRVVEVWGVDGDEAVHLTDIEYLYEPMAEHATISRAGDAVAYIKDNLAYVWEHGQSTGIAEELGIVTALSWSAPAWRVRPM